MENPLTVLQQIISSGAQRNPASISFEKSYLKRCLQVAHMLTNRRLGDVKNVACTREASGFGDSTEDLELPKGDCHRSSPDNLAIIFEGTDYRNVNSPSNEIGRACTPIVSVRVKRV